VPDSVRASQPPTVGDASFDAYYYAHCCGDPYHRGEALQKFFGNVAGRIVSDLAPGSVLDAGCAIGLLVEALRERGVEAMGIDLSSYAIEHVHETVRAYCQHGSIADEFPRRYDVIISIEVLEHMPAREAEAAIANFCRHTDDVIFSSSPSDYKEPTHVNVHPPGYWASEFARHGFYRDVDFDASFITPWAARFRRSAEPFHRVIGGYERRFWELTLESNDTRAYSMATQGQLAAQIADSERLRLEAEQAAKAMADAQAEAAAARQQLDAARAEAAAAQAVSEAVRRQMAVAASDNEFRLGIRANQMRRVETELSQARDRIFHMERSLFWRARLLLRRLRGSR
jgi:SAM-dependent methyltransferase